MKKIKIFALIGAIGFLFMGGLVIWAGLSTLNYVASKTNEALHSPAAKERLESVKAEIGTLPKMNALNCWDKAQSLMNIRPWLEQPAVNNLINLKVACFESKQPVCEGNGCEHMKDLMNTAKGTTI